MLGVRSSGVILDSTLNNLALIVTFRIKERQRIQLQTYACLAPRAKVTRVCGCRLASPNKCSQESFGYVTHSIGPQIGSTGWLLLRFEFKSSGLQVVAEHSSVKDFGRVTMKFFVKAAALAAVLGQAVRLLFVI